jgi:hypothetical protein
MVQRRGASAYGARRQPWTILRATIAMGFRSLVEELLLGFWVESFTLEFAPTGLPGLEPLASAGLFGSRWIWVWWRPKI